MSERPPDAMDGRLRDALLGRLATLLARFDEEFDVELREQAEALARALESHATGAWDLELTDEQVRHFQQVGEDAPYYVILDPRGQVIDRSRPIDVPPTEGLGPRTRGELREVVVAGAAGASIVVGRAAAPASRLRGLVGGVAGTTAARLMALAESLGSRRAPAPASRTPAPRATTFDRLKAAFDRQARFTADASHELRTPLAILTSHLELALRKERTPAEYQEAIRTALRAAARMRSVVEGLLTLARADAGEPTLLRERVDVRALTDETAGLLRPLAEARAVTVQVAPGGGAPCLVLGDPGRLRQVLTNLVTNAITYNRAGGRVDLALDLVAEGVEARARLSVADTGIGIPAADHGHVFERFFRVDEARSREAGGTGLGLAITRWIVEAHGGEISFTSREGEGTTFVVELPAAPKG